MDEPIKISIYTTVYNTKPYVAQCVESVLNQTYTNFEYIILDNGCTDGSSEILSGYASRDGRIKLIRREENQYGYISSIILTCGDGDYMAVLDSDDWLEPQFLERLVSLAVKYDLDIACAGSYTYYESSGEERPPQKVPSQPTIVYPEEFQSAFLQYRSYLNAIWGKIIRMDVARQAYSEPCIYSIWAVDTVIGFRMLCRCRGMGIEESILHHYLVRAGSLSVAYHPTRFAGTAYLYEYLLDFLNRFGPVLPENIAAIGENYIADIMETLEITQNTDISQSEKLTEYLQILGHPLTRNFFQQQPRSELSYPVSKMVGGLLNIFLSSGLSQEEISQAYPQVQAALHTAAPRTCAAVTEKNMRLFLEDTSFIRMRIGEERLHQFYMEHHRTFLLLFGSRSPLRFLPGNSVPLLQSLSEDNPDAVLRKLKKLARKRGYAERYALPEAIRMLEQSLKEAE